MLEPGDVISYLDMCREEGCNLQRGMNYRLHGRHSVILMSVRRDAPYADRVEADGRVLIYEGHDAESRRGGPDPKTISQPLTTPHGSLTQNGRFYEAAQDYQAGIGDAERVRVYEKILSGVWVYNGFFRLVQAWQEWNGTRDVFKFRLEAADEVEQTATTPQGDLSHSRLIPSSVKLAVWRRDRGQCVRCQSTDNLHFDHVIPFSKGGSSLVADNVQILCARHNLSKSDRIE